MTEELERKAEQFAEEHAFRVPYDGSNKFYDDTDYKASKDGYIAGATEATKEPKKNHWYEMYELECLKTKELQKENAELKKQQFSLRNERNNFLAQNEQYEKDLIDFNENLTKAKEIIKKIEKIFYSGENAIRRLSKMSDIFEEAEQFLRESEK